MADEGKTSTYGFDHVGLSVRDLATRDSSFAIALDGTLSESGRTIRQHVFRMDSAS